MEQKTSTIDQHLDERRQKVRRWLGERATSFALADSPEAYQENSDAFEVRAYQLEAWANLWDARQAGKERGLVYLATGLGKTSIAVFDVMKFREEQMAQDPPVVPRVLFLSHMNDISEQAQERFTHFMPELDMDFFKTGRNDLPDADITFATFQSIRSELDRFDPQDFEYIIYDEAHHSEADTFREVRDYFDPLFELGITATPDRMDDRDIRDYFGEALYSKTLAEGIAEGWLADVDYHIVFDDIVKQLMEEGFEPKTLKEFRELFKVKPRNEVIAKNIREERHKIGLDEAKTMVFCEDIEHANEMAELLGGVAYHSDLKKDDRKRILADFRTGTHQVICTVDAFNEGIDIPDARLVVFLRSTQSGTIFEQQLGRGLRKTKGKDEVSVLDFVANIERIQKVQELSDGIRKATTGGDTEGAENEFPTAKDTYPTGGDGGEVLGKESGLHIHTEHGEFDFSRIAVDLLKKWGALKHEVAELPPKGWISVNQAATLLGVQPDTILRHAEKIGWELPDYQFQAQVGRALSTEQMEQLYDFFTSLVVIPEDHVTLNDFAEESGVSRPTIERLVEDLGLDLSTFLVGPSKNRTVALSPSQQEVVRGTPEFTTLRAPEDYLTFNTFIRTHQTTQKTLKELLEELSIVPEVYKTSDGQVRPMISPAQELILLEHEYFKLRAPEGYLTAGGFAKKYSIPKRRVHEVIINLELELPTYRFKTGIYPGLSAEHQTMILSVINKS